MQLSHILNLAAVLVAAVRADHPVPVENPKEVLKSQYTGKLGLNDLAKKHGKYFGTASDVFNVTEMNTDEPYMKELYNKRDWGSLTSCNAMKWENIHPEEHRYAFEEADQFVRIAKKDNAKLRCHNLAWHSQNPNWLIGGNWTRKTAFAKMDEHIETVMTHFGDDCYAWDVVNEALNDDGTYRSDSFWYKLAGKQYIQHAFDTALRVKKQHHLKTKLYYNDYNIETVDTKYKAAVKMIRDHLLGHGIDGVGFQGHYEVGNAPTYEHQLDRIKGFADMGLDVAYTELDVRALMPPSVDVQKQHAKDYETVVRACRDAPRCVGITVWDFDDEYSWIPNVFKNHSWGLPWFQPDGVNTTLVRKISYDGIVDGWTKLPQQQQQ